MTGKGQEKGSGMHNVLGFDRSVQSVKVHQTVYILFCTHVILHTHTPKKWDILICCLSSPYSKSSWWPSLSYPAGSKTLVARSCLFPHGFPSSHTDTDTCLLFDKWFWMNEHASQCYQLTPNSISFMPFTLNSAFSMCSRSWYLFEDTIMIITALYLKIGVRSFLLIISFTHHKQPVS